MSPQTRADFLKRLGRDPANPAAPGDFSTVTSPDYPDAPNSMIYLQERGRYGFNENPEYGHDYRNYGAGVQPSPVGPGMLPTYPMNQGLVGVAGGDWNALPRGRALIESAMTPSPMPMQGLLVQGNIGNLYNRRTLYNPGEGNYSTIETNSFQPDRGPFQGKEVLIPTVVGGRRLTMDQAQDRFYRTGEHLGVFATPADADRYAWWLHWEQVRRGGGTRPPGR